MFHFLSVFLLLPPPPPAPPCRNGGQWAPSVSVSLWFTKLIVSKIYWLPGPLIIVIITFSNYTISLFHSLHVKVTFVSTFSLKSKSWRQKNSWDLEKCVGHISDRDRVCLYGRPLLSLSVLCKFTVAQCERCWFNLNTMSQCYHVTVVPCHISYNICESVAKLSGSDICVAW